MRLSDEKGRALCVLRRGKTAIVSVEKGRLHIGQDSKRLITDRVCARAEGGVVSINGRRYRGEIALRPVGGASSIAVFNVLPLEDYLRSVVPAEIPRSFHPEAIRAQAILSRTIAMNWKGRHAREGEDFCDLTHCQVYQGLASETAVTDEAVRQTAGLVLAREGRPAQAYYHSTCGGHTADAGGAWAGAQWPEHLRGVPDLLEGKPACAKSPHATWKASVSQKELDDALGLIGAQIAITQSEKCGRVREVRVRRPGGEKRMTGEEFHLLMGRRLGWARVKSAWFDVKRRGDSWEFAGKGLGHGVGFCQWGANARCQAGASCAQVLAYYFPGTRVQSAGASGDRSRRL